MDRHRDSYRRLTPWWCEERIRLAVEATLSDTGYTLNPDDVVIITDDIIDIIATELERAST